MTLIVRETCSLTKHKSNTAQYLSISDLRVEQAGDAELLLGHSEGQAVVVQDVARVETLNTAAQQAGPEVVYQGAEGDPVPPALVHVQDVHILIERSHASAPDLGEKYTLVTELGYHYHLSQISGSGSVLVVIECKV